MNPPPGPSVERIATRLRRLEQQIAAFKELHATELQLILDELSDIAGELDTAPEASSVPTDDPAANSPKRAKWLEDQERRTEPLSRRELLRGRGEDPG